MNYIMLLGEAIFQPNITSWLRPFIMALCLVLGIAEVVVVMMQKPQNEISVSSAVRRRTLIPKRIRRNQKRVY